MPNEVIELYLDDIIPNRFQPREKFDEEALNELSASIKEHGVIQPIIVRKIGEKYEIIAGERRYKASALAGLTKIPAIIRNLDDKEASKVALLENLQRQDLTAIEEARTYQKILDLDTMTQEELGRTMGKSQASIANKLRLLSLSDEVQEALLNNQISERHARSLLNLKNGNEQIEMLNKIIRDRLSVRELDIEIKKIKDGMNTSIDFNKEEKIDLPFYNQPIEHLDEQHEYEEILTTNNSEIKTSSFIPSFDNNPEPTGNTFIPSFTPSKAPVIINEDQEIIEDNNTSNNNNSLEPFKLNEAIDTVRNIIPQLQNKGIKVISEEYDLGGKYQIIINIDKNKI